MNSNETQTMNDNDSSQNLSYRETAPLNRNRDKPSISWEMQLTFSFLPLSRQGLHEHIARSLPRLLVSRAALCWCCFSVEVPPVTISFRFWLSLQLCLSPSVFVQLRGYDLSRSNVSLGEDSFPFFWSHLLLFWCMFQVIAEHSYFGS